MDLHPIAVRLKAQVAAFRVVGLAGDFPSAQQNLRVATPAAFILPSAERAGPNEHITSVMQRVQMRFSVVYAVQNLRDMQGDAAQTDLDALRQATKGALIGWQPTGADSPITFGGGRLVKWADGVLWWMDDFDTTFYERAVA